MDKIIGKPEATPAQVQTILVLWLLFSTGNRIDYDTWTKILDKISGQGKLPPGVTPEMMLKSAVDNAPAIGNAIGDFKAYTAPASVAGWGGGTSCPNLETILAMFP